MLSQKKSNIAFKPKSNLNTNDTKVEVVTPRNISNTKSPKPHEADEYNEDFEV
jgi:hypothetical protein